MGYYCHIEQIHAGYTFLCLPKVVLVGPLSGLDPLQGPLHMDLIHGPLFLQIPVFFI